MNNITTTYHDIKIEYHEYTNDWRFTLRGRERIASSLKLAKEAIDKPVPKKAKPFVRFEAWSSKYSRNDLKTCTVMSLVARESRCRSEQQVRIKDDEGQRETDITSVFPKNAVNDELVRQIEVLQDQIDDIGAKKDKLKENLVPMKEVEDEPDDQPT